MLNQPHLRPSALIFDMDGLMIDSERLYFAAEREMAAAYGIEIRDEQLWPLMGRKPIESLRLLREILKIDMSARGALRLAQPPDARQMRHDLGAMPGLFEILDAFHGRLKLAVGTGAQMEFLDIALDTLRIRGYFDVLQTADAIERGKPDPEIYLLTCRRLGLPPRGVRRARGRAQRRPGRQGRRLPGDRRAQRLHARPGLLRRRLGGARPLRRGEKDREFAGLAYPQY